MKLKIRSERLLVIQVSFRLWAVALFSREWKFLETPSFLARQVSFLERRFICETFWQTPTVCYNRIWARDVLSKHKLDRFWGFCWLTLILRKGCCMQKNTLPQDQDDPWSKIDCTFHSKRILALFQNVSRTCKAVSHQGLSNFLLGCSGLLLSLAVLSEFLSTSTRNAKKIPGNGFTKTDRIHVQDTSTWSSVVRVNNTFCLRALKVGEKWLFTRADLIRKNIFWTIITGKFCQYGHCVLEVRNKNKFW